MLLLAEELNWLQSVFNSHTYTYILASPKKNKNNEIPKHFNCANKSNEWKTIEYKCILPLTTISYTSQMIFFIFVHPFDYNSLIVISRFVSWIWLIFSISFNHFVFHQVFCVVAVTDAVTDAVFAYLLFQFFFSVFAVFYFCSLLLS